MRFAWISLVSLFFNLSAFGVDYYLKSGEYVKLGDDKVFCAAPKKAPFECTEQCQYFDEFKKVCLYKIKCNFTENCMTKTQCEKWDEFKKTCYSETSEMYCKDMQTTCTEKCTHYDEFKKTCYYKTNCVYAAGCYLETYCEKWDEFKKVCLSEAKKTTCYEF